MSPGAPPGPGGLAAPGGGEAGAQGEGWARLPERTYCPGLAGSPAGAFWAPAAAPPEPGRGTRLPPVGAKARGMDPALPPRPAPVSCPGPPAPGAAPGAPGRNFARSRRASGREGRVWGTRRKLGGTRGRSPRPAPRTATAYSGEALRPGRAGPGGPCALADAMSPPGDWLAPQASRPPASAAQQPGAAARPGSAAGPRRVLPQPLRKCPGPSAAGVRSVPGLPRRPPAAAAHPSLVLWVADLRAAVEVRRR